MFNNENNVFLRHVGKWASSFIFVQNILIVGTNLGPEIPPVHSLQFRVDQLTEEANPSIQSHSVQLILRYTSINIVLSLLFTQFRSWGTFSPCEKAERKSFWLQYCVYTLSCANNMLLQRKQTKILFHDWRCLLVEKQALWEHVRNLQR